MATHLLTSLVAGHTNGAASAQVPAWATDLVLVRHGETTWNRERRIQGQMDSALNETGRVQARAVAMRLAAGDLPCSAVYSSDLSRAADTAQAIADCCGLAPVIKDPGLRERHAGSVQGLTPEEASKEQPLAFRCFLSRDPSATLPGGGESLQVFRERVAATVAGIAKKHRGERVVVVSHGGAIIATHMRIKGKNPSSCVDNASISIIRVPEAGPWEILRWGDVEHLADLNLNGTTFGGGVDSA